MTTRRSVVWGLLFAVVLATTGARPATDAGAGDSRVAGSEFVKIRKLHLVRPDLIHYPLALETYC